MNDAQRSPFTELRIRSFEGQIMYFNGMYKLPVAPYPSLSHLNQSAEDRLLAFKATLLKEVEEVDEIISKMRSIAHSDVEILTDIADWLGDITIYCASEAAKFGLPMKEILRIIMQSNFSKLQADGTVKYDANGKVEKGPGYWKPEPLLRDLLEDAIREHQNGGKNGQTGD